MKRCAAVIIWCVLVLAGCEGDRGMPAETQTAPARTEVEDNASEAVRVDTTSAARIPLCDGLGDPDTIDLLRPVGTGSARCAPLYAGLRSASRTYANFRSNTIVNHN